MPWRWFRICHRRFHIDGHRHPVDVIRGHRHEHCVAEALREIVVLDAGVDCVAEDGSEDDVFDAPVGLQEKGGAPKQSDYDQSPSPDTSIRIGTEPGGPRISNS